MVHSSGWVFEMNAPHCESSVKFEMKEPRSPGPYQGCYHKCSVAVLLAVPNIYWNIKHLFGSCKNEGRPVISRS